MQLWVAINGASILALLDSWSTHNFIGTEMAAWVGIVFTGHGGLRVAVANDDQFISLGCYRAMSFSLHGETFNIDCYDLALGFFEMVLGVQWLESLGPILWDFSRRTMAFVCNEHWVTWSAPDTATASPTSLLATSGDIMEELLGEFDPLFAAPTNLPPPWAREHRIQLILGTTPVAGLPYRYAHAQKEELEKECTKML
jgi:hypothetical protein